MIDRLGKPRFGSFTVRVVAGAARAVFLIGTVD
jgi:hypothetical protein